MLDAEASGAPGRGGRLSVGAFFGLTFLTSWILWGAAGAVPGLSSDGTRALLFLPGTFAPALVAVVLTRVNDGARGTRALLGRLLLWNVGFRWYLFAAGYMIAIKLGAALVHRGITGAWPAFSSVPVYLLLAAALFSTVFQAGEEIGWRGFALPRLTARMGLGAASVVLGVVWALWHLPLFFISETTTTGQSFPVYMLSVTALSVAMAWLYARTGGSLLLVMLMHAAINNTKDIVPSPSSAGGGVLALDASLLSWITMALLWLGAAWLLVRMRHLPRAGAAPSLR